MSLRNVDIESALRRLAERRIEEAMKEGKFDNLPGAGKPLDLEPLPADENARMLWWALRIMRQNDVIPDEVQWRKAVDTLKQQLSHARNESAVRHLCRQINELVHRLNNLGTNAINLPNTGVDEEAEVLRWKDQQSYRPPDSSSERF
jgi:hypothetical protein